MLQSFFGVFDKIDLYNFSKWIFERENIIIFDLISFMLLKIMKLV
jgi:hypothetical protein